MDAPLKVLIADDHPLLLQSMLCSTLQRPPKPVTSSI